MLRNGDSVLVSSIGGGIMKLSMSQGRWNLIPSTEGLAATLAAGPRGTFFAAARNLMAQFSSGGKIIAKSTIANDLDAGTYLATTQERDLWLGRIGINRIFQHGNRFSLQRDSAVPNDPVLDLQYDSPHDTLWACDGKQVIFRKNGAWRHITQKDGVFDLIARLSALSRVGICGLVTEPMPSRRSKIQPPPPHHLELHRVAKQRCPEWRSPLSFRGPSRLVVVGE
jgi:hypothetical protein